MRQPDGPIRDILQRVRFVLTIGRAGRAGSVFSRARFSFLVLDPMRVMMSLAATSSTKDVPNPGV